MKIKIKKKSKLFGSMKSKLYSQNSGGGSNEGVASWAVTDPNQFRALSKQAKFQSRRAPEVWVLDGQTRLLRFVDPEPVVSFEGYRFMQRGKWQRHVRPPDGEPDLYASVLGLNSSRFFVYRVIDIEGYTNKKGKRFTNMARFLVAGARMYDQIAAMRREKKTDSPPEELTQYNVRMSRTGTQTSTVYTFMPKSASPLTPEMKKAIGSFPNWRDYYRPLSEAEQRSVIATAGGSPGDPPANMNNDDEDED